MEQYQKKEIEQTKELLKKEYIHWREVYENGCRDPFYADGTNLNLIRSHIVNFKKRIVEQLSEKDYPKEMFLDTPPKVPDNYMARTAEIRENAKKTLEIYKKNEDYLWLNEHCHALNQKQKKQVSIEAVLGYVHGLEMYIEQDSLVDMRRHEKPQNYMDAFSVCRKRIEELCGELCITKNLPEGQLSLFDVFCF